MFLSVNELPKIKTDKYHILIAHNPEFVKTYFKYGADLVLSGHFHGGVFRIGKQGILSPYLKFFPKYAYGKYMNKNQCMIVSGGLEDHSIKRIWNPYELVCIDVAPSQ